MLEERKVLEQLENDPSYGKRIHAWVVILSNVPWAAKKTANADNSDSGTEIRPFFIEPSTGFHFDENDPNYLGIESVWNDQNYYVSR